MPGDTGWPSAPSSWITHQGALYWTRLEHRTRLASILLERRAIHGQATNSKCPLALFLIQKYLGPHNARLEMTTGIVQQFAICQTLESGPWTIIISTLKGFFKGFLCVVFVSVSCPPRDPEVCGAPWGYPKHRCTEWTNVPEECPHMCGVCQGGKCTLI